MIQQDIKAAIPVGACLFIGQNRCGRWVVKDARGLCGGLFANRAEAMRFAMCERQRRPQPVIVLANGLELDEFAEGPSRSNGARLPEQPSSAKMARQAACATACEYRSSGGDDHVQALRAR